MDNNIKVLISELIDDLKIKIENISKIAQSDDIQIQNQLLNIRNKAINVLFTVSDKLYDACNEYDDIDDLYKSVDIVKDRANKLYEEVISRVEELKNTKDNDNHEFIEDKEEINDVQDIEETVLEFKEPINQINEEVNEKALDTLKGWLLPKGDDK